MALPPRSTLMLASLAKRGDTFARAGSHSLHLRDYIRLLNWAKRGDREAQKFVNEANTTVAAKAVISHLARDGDYIAQTINALTTEKSAQTITFSPGLNAGADTPFIITATTTAKLPITFKVTSGPATVAVISYSESPNYITTAQLTFSGTGTVVVSANQYGNGNYNAATPVSASIVVATSARTFMETATPGDSIGNIAKFKNTISESASPGDAVARS